MVILSEEKLRRELVWVKFSTLLHLVSGPSRHLLSPFSSNSSFLSQLKPLLALSTSWQHNPGPSTKPLVTKSFADWGCYACPFSHDWSKDYKAVFK